MSERQVSCLVSKSMLKRIVPSLAQMSKSHFSFAHKLVETVESEKQELFLDKENCILVDESDIPIGYTSKRDCHKVDEHQHIKLHRAFSVFLFNKKGEMLMQKRSSHKVSRLQTVRKKLCNTETTEIQSKKKFHDIETSFLPPTIYLKEEVSSNLHFIITHIAN